MSSSPSNAAVATPSAPKGRANAGGAGARRRNPIMERKAGLYTHLTELKKHIRGAQAVTEEALDTFVRAAKDFSEAVTTERLRKQQREERKAERAAKAAAKAAKAAASGAASGAAEGVEATSA
jgi:hypothetical protein